MKSVPNPSFDGEAEMIVFADTVKLVEWGEEPRRFGKYIVIGFPWAEHSALWTHTRGAKGNKVAPCYSALISTQGFTDNEINPDLGKFATGTPLYNGGVILKKVHDDYAVAWLQVETLEPFRGQEGAMIDVILREDNIP